MCFSPIASFAAFVVLTAISVTGFALNFRYGRKDHRHMWWCPLAMPLIFGIQQAAEGVVWLHIDENGTCSASAIFSFFAFVWWPSFVPGMGLWMTGLLDSKSSKWQVRVRSCLLALLLAAGLIVSSYLATGLYGPGGSHAASKTNEHRIDYNIQFLNWGFEWAEFYAINVLYLVCTMLPFVIAVPHGEVQCFWTIGVVIGSSSALCYGVFPDSFPSTWCFFSAWISTTVIAVFLADLRRKIQDMPVDQEQAASAFKSVEI
eukprot:gnl/TRDRNA2_/TRDRNA2_190557_c0_seq1.p1 gnl/TRDRNA2_/TRDRNA2_190557_c0~~gnl/TRDRNA2_/TRDRNA2_190557_c0_seq1.p1  ORF type:complete len:260 (+),score=13.88 gnl/TRDRNA2_/TRDRNA2_190557_c0_seq1:79-858(+)